MGHEILPSWDFILSASQGRGGGCRRDGGGVGGVFKKNLVKIKVVELGQRGKRLQKVEGD